MIRPTRLASIWVAVALMAAASSAPAEIYRWVDAAGRMHFTQDIGQVPASHRAAALDASKASPKRELIQHYAAPPARTSSSASTRARTLQGSGEAGREHRIRIERSGTMIRVVATLNDRLEVPFYLDTGATDVLLPMWAARELGLPIEGEGVRTRVYSTANGIVENPVIRLDSVRLGTARVENVVGAASDAMEVGLLGLSFLNHFETRVDSANGVLTLRENGMKQNGLIRGGRSENDWRSQFYGLTSRIAAVDAKIEEIPRSRARLRERGEEVLADLQQQLAILEDEADDARVPFSWRE